MQPIGQLVAQTLAILATKLDGSMIGAYTNYDENGEVVTMGGDFMPSPSLEEIANMLEDDATLEIGADVEPSGDGPHLTVDSGDPAQ